MRAKTRAALACSMHRESLLASQLSAEGFCSGLRQIIEAAKDRAELEALLICNAGGLARLRLTAPDLKSRQGEHYADILQRLAAKRLAAVGPSEAIAKAGFASAEADGQEANDLKEAQLIPPAFQDASAKSIEIGAPDETVATNPSRLGAGIAIDKSRLSLATTRRLRSKAHLLFVASKPCLICEELPCAAHHITFAQVRGLSVKVSDEFTVPLCPLHHNELHAQANERVFWRKHNTDPLKIARALWQATLSLSDGTRI